jgi:excisionase family DNA binding protein
VPDLDLLDVQQAAKRLGSTVHFVRALIAADELRYVKVGKKFCVTQADLDRWVLTNRRLRSEEDGEILGTGSTRRLNAVR